MSEEKNTEATEEVDAADVPSDKGGDSEEKSEYVALVNWFVTLNREDAKFKSKSGIYTPQKVKASLDNQPITVQFLESEFEIDLKELME